ncbi:site-specific integrase [Parashewanella curva]|uniref:Site-specific integrase n=1 Tax=Parashewanella curva TaxID=2338552 RepID=A0A3L8PR63_9GAMM|nr:site-specific integrase [Parashewanella curva]RLV57694.1 site-specific integrase [Parashewanella curva]
MFDFSSIRAQRRPTYLYFTYLSKKRISAQNINSRTATIYKWFEFHQVRYNIELERIDQTYRAYKQFQNKQGQTFIREVKTRLLTATVPKKFMPKLGHVYDDGEELRPLENAQVDALYKALYSNDFNTDERLIFEIALDTGARIQTILTIRLRHIDSFVPKNLHPDGCYKLQAGLGTDIDTKFDKRLVVSIPHALAEKLKIYAYCEEAKKRRCKFKQNFGEEVFRNEKDMYLFLGRRGDCRYMAKSDPRYASTNSKPNGRSISVIVARLKRVLPSTFPQNYVFHWNRATFAYISYQLLKPLLDSKEITFDMLIGWIQSSLGHANPETTLEYLKLL